LLLLKPLVRRLLPKPLLLLRLHNKPLMLEFLP
jgi:hypothetical protein